MDDIQTKIKNFISRKITVSHLIVDGDGSHFQAVVVSNAFDGLNRVDRHKLVYDALGNCFEKDVHALSFKTYTEDEWKNLR
tara:strand:- start:455 stop:697 length:243 start_codon:yes stop_codon:yes gene_type:complete